MMDPRFARRRHEVMQERSWKSIRRLGVVGLVVALVGLGVWILRSPMLAIDEVVVNGAVHAPIDEALAEAGIVAGRPLVSVSEARLDRAIAHDPWVRSVSVHRSWSGRVVVDVTERVAIASVGLSDGWYEIAGDGTLLDPLDGPTPGLSVIQAPFVSKAGIAAGGWVPGAVEFLDVLSSPVPVTVALQSEELWASVGGYRVRLGRPIDMAEKARVLTAILAQRPPADSTINVIAPSRPAVVLPGESTTTTTSGA